MIEIREEIVSGVGVTNWEVPDSYLKELKQDGMKIFVVPHNDLESKEICNMLHKNETGKLPSVMLFETDLGWNNASWDNLEDKTKEKLDNIAKNGLFLWKDSTHETGHTFLIYYGTSSDYSVDTTFYRIGTMEEYNKDKEKDQKIKDCVITKESRFKDHPTIMTHEKLSEPVKIPCHIYGVELRGKNPYNAIDIDHHSYDDEDRRNELSSIEQVAKIANMELNDWQKLVAANDRGYIPEMKKIFPELSTNRKFEKQMIDSVREKERKIQGITPEQEKQAEEAINNREETDDLTIVHCEHSKTAPICDRLFGRYENMLVVSKDGEYNFFGKSEVCEKLQQEYGGWTGDTKNQKNTFWGVSKPTEEYPNEKYEKNEDFVKDTIYQSLQENSKHHENFFERFFSK